MKSLPFFIAKRYLVSRKSHSVINLIARVSAFAVGIPVAAMVILLSVFNGFEGLVKQMYRDFDPDIAVSLVEGKTFGSEGGIADIIEQVAGVEEISHVLEDNALLEYRGAQYIGTIRGVDANYTNVVPIEKMVIDGNYELLFGDMEQAVVGQGIAYTLGIRPALLDPIKVLVPRLGGSFSSLLPVDVYKEGRVFPAGVFALDAETDSKYVITSIEFARELFGYSDGTGTFMVKVADGHDHKKVQEAIKNAVGPGYKVLTRYEQKASLYQIMNYEKWGIFMIILMVMVIASFSIIGSLVMLIIDKRADIRTIANMGGTAELIRGIFIREGMLFSTIGAVCGLVLGLLLCWLQMAFGIIRIPADTFLVDSYPVIVKAWDIAAVAVAFLCVNYFISKVTVLKMIPRNIIRS